MPDGICFDHDLGFNINSCDESEIKYYNGQISFHSLEPYDRLEKSGYDCAKWLCTYCEAQQVKLPPYAIQSQNTIGKENINKFLQNYKKFVEQNQSENE